jgi:aspartyl-tRNA synthetase
MPPSSRRRAHRVGEELGLIDEDRLRARWIVDFPFYEWNEDEKKVDFSHNPFSMPQGGMEALRRNQDPLTIKAFQYDLVCNGFEIASGSIRNHQARNDGEGLRDHRADARPTWRSASAACTAPSSMARRRTAAWRPASTASSCCWCGAKNLREITLFPMNQQAEDLLMGAPLDADLQAFGIVEELVYCGTHRR